MPLPQPVEKLWDELERARAGVLREAEGLSQRQADWKPSEHEWSVGEILHHLTLAEVGTGKLTSKLLRGRVRSPCRLSARPDRRSRRSPAPPAGPAEAPRGRVPGARQLDRAS